jgi:hypothetical protein
MQKLYCYVDESANLSDENQFFIVAIVSTQTPKDFERILKRARSDVLRKKKRQAPEIKFSRVVSRAASYVLAKLAEKDVTLYAWVIDKEGRRVQDTAENYGLVLAYVLQYGFTFGNWNMVWIDEKYTKVRDKEKLRETLQALLGSDIMETKQIMFERSEREPGLGIADFVAGAFHAAYNRNDTRFIELLRPKLAVEEKVLWRHIKQRATAPRGSDGPV